MVTTLTLLHLAQVILLAVGLPLTLIAVRGYWGAPLGRALVALPVMAAGFLLSATDELVGLPDTGTLTFWELGSALGVLAFCWLTVALLLLVSARWQVSA